MGRSFHGTKRFRVHIKQLIIVNNIRYWSLIKLWLPNGCYVKEVGEDRIWMGVSAVEASLIRELIKVIKFYRAVFQSKTSIWLSLRSTN